MRLLNLGRVLTRHRPRSRLRNPGAQESWMAVQQESLPNGEMGDGTVVVDWGKLYWGRWVPRMGKGTVELHQGLRHDQWIIPLFLMDH